MRSRRGRWIVRTWIFCSSASSWSYRTFAFWENKKPIFGNGEKSKLLTHRVVDVFAEVYEWRFEFRNSIIPARSSFFHRDCVAFLRSTLFRPRWPLWLPKPIGHYSYSYLPFRRVRSRQSAPGESAKHSKTSAFTFIFLKNYFYIWNWFFGMCGLCRYVGGVSEHACRVARIISFIHIWNGKYRRSTICSVLCSLPSSLSSVFDHRWDWDDVQSRRTPNSNAVLDVGLYFIVHANTLLLVWSVTPPFIRS